MSSSGTKNRIICDMPSGHGKSRVTGSFIYLCAQLMGKKDFKVVYSHQTLLENDTAMMNIIRATLGCNDAAQNIEPLQ